MDLVELEKEVKELKKRIELLEETIRNFRIESILFYGRLLGINEEKISEVKKILEGHT